MSCIRIIMTSLAFMVAAPPVYGQGSTLPVPCSQEILNYRESGTCLDPSQEVGGREFARVEVSAPTIKQLYDSNSFVSDEARNVIDALKDGVNLDDNNAGFIYLTQLTPDDKGITDVFCELRLRQGVDISWAHASMLSSFDPPASKCYDIGKAILSSISRMYAKETALIVSPFDTILFASYPDTKIASKYGAPRFDATWLLVKEFGDSEEFAWAREKYKERIYKMPIRTVSVDGLDGLRSLAEEEKLDWQVLRTINYDTLKNVFSDGGTSEITVPSKPVEGNWSAYPVFGTAAEIAGQVYGRPELEGIVQRIIDVAAVETGKDQIFLPEFEGVEELEFRDVVGFL